MSFDVPVSFVQQYKDNVYMLSQQKGSKLSMFVRQDGDVVGDRVYFDRIGATEAQQVTSRHADTPLMNTPHSRRSAVMSDYDWADLIDRKDKLKMLIDPTGPYTRAGAWAMGRKKDDLIISAALGTAATGVDGSGSQALPSAQKIAAGAAGLTVAKVLAAKEIIDGSDVDDDIPRVCICTAGQITDMLNQNEVKSADYNTIKALAAGEIDTFAGFKFIRTERLTTDGSGDRQVIFMTTEAIGLGVPEELYVDVGPRRDKRNSMQVYVSGSYGAVRIEDAQVVECACTE